ncbi:MAG TPA: hypothetical protein VF131_20735 [Blastocatellia bacterium]|nr:hypothetical protein [Blastocatellia bacterium]
MRSLIGLWEEAASMDFTLQVRRRDIQDLRRKRVYAENYSRARLFSRMAKGQVSLFKDFPVCIEAPSGANPREVVSKMIKTGFPNRQTARVQTGPSRTRYRLKIPEVMRRWEGERAILGVTDLHFRGTKFERALDFSALNDFDILCTDPNLVHFIEMMTLVISSRGNVTDSHADDCDGSNHCFVGKKLWLAWDRIEGKAKGFQDIDRDYVTEQAAFDMRTFISLPSARWFLVNPNETLFLPGSLAHKVITIKHYIGVGGFYVTLPNYLRSLKRWILYDTLDITPKGLLGDLNKAVIQKIREVQKGPNSLKHHWGLSYMQKAIEKWEKDEEFETKEVLLKNQYFKAFLEATCGLAKFPRAAKPMAGRYACPQ